MNKESLDKFIYYCCILQCAFIILLLSYAYIFDNIKFNLLFSKPLFVLILIIYLIAASSFIFKLKRGKNKW